MSLRQSKAQAELLLELLDSSDKELLRRGAVFRYLTRDAAKLATGSQHDANRLLKIPILRPLNRGSNSINKEVWEIPLKIRRALLQESDSAKEIRNSIAKSATKEGHSPENLFVRLSANEHAANARLDLEKEFDSALAQSIPDIPRAHDLTRLLTEWPVTEDSQSEELFEQLTPKLNRYARAIRDFEGSATYLDREFESKVQTTLFDSRNQQQWMMQIHAPGGRGKTMYLRNLLGRYCPQRDVPVARIDFDYLEHLSINCRQPWRILLAIAKQLNVQLPNNPFHHMLISRGDYSAQLTSEPLPAQRSFSAPSEWLSGQTYAKDTPRKFREELARVIKDSDLNGNVLIVLDTFENVLHTAGASLAPLLQMLNEIRTGNGNGEACVPGLRVIMCGRFDLTSSRSLTGESAEKSKKFREDWFLPEIQTTPNLVGKRNSAGIKTGRAIVSVELKDFLWSESEDYLRNKCLLHDKKKITAVLERCHEPDQQNELRANPMRLALIGKYLKDHPEVGASEIKEFENLELFYLINRVVDRIADGKVQWLLRWGVLPSILTKEFVEEILWPALVNYHENQTNYDAPAISEKVIASDFKRERWAQLSIDSVKKSDAADAAWQGLLTYAAGASWVSINDELSNAVTFHRDVRDPLRNLLRQKDHPVFHDIHAKAYAYWNDRLSSSEGKQLTAVLRGVTHHLYQPWSEDGRNDGAIRRHSGKLVRELLGRFATNRLARQELAAGILRAVRLAELSDANPPSGDEQICACLEIAEFRVYDSVISNSPLEETDLQFFLSEAEILVGRRSEQELQANLTVDSDWKNILEEEQRRLKFLNAVLQFKRNEVDAGWNLFSESLRDTKPVTPDDLAHFHLVIDVATALDVQTKPLGVARKLAKAGKGTPAEDKALSYLAGSLVWAEKWQEALKVSRNAGNKDLEAQALLELGRAKAVKANKEFSPLCRAEAAIQRLEPEFVLKSFANVDEKNTKMRLVLAKAELLRNEFSKAKVHLSAAMSTDIGSVLFEETSASQCWLQLCRVLIDQGHYGQAYSEISRPLFRTDAQDDRSLQVRAELTEFLIEHYESDNVAAPRILDRILNPPRNSKLPPSVLVEIELTRLEINGATDDALATLAIALEQMDHYKTRLLALRGLSRVDPSETKSSKTNKIVQTLEKLTAGRISEPALKLGRAELLRVVGKKEASKILIEDVIGAALPEMATFVTALDKRFIPQNSFESTRGEFNSGVIKSLSDQGFGFIQAETGEEMFFHSSTVEGVSFDNLREGQNISYQEDADAKVPKVQQVRALGLDSKEVHHEAIHCDFPDTTFRFDISKRNDDWLTIKPQLTETEAPEFGSQIAKLESVNDSHYRFAKDPVGFRNELEDACMRDSLREVWDDRMSGGRSMIVEMQTRDEWSAKMPWELAGPDSSRLVDEVSAIVRVVESNKRSIHSDERTLSKTKPIPSPIVYVTSGVEPEQSFSKSGNSFGHYELELIGEAYDRLSSGDLTVNVDFSPSGNEHLEESLHNDDVRVFHFISPIINHRDRAGLQMGNQSLTAESFAALLSNRSPRLVIFDLLFSHSEIDAAEQLMLANALFWAITKAEPAISIIGGVFGSDRRRKEALERLTHGLDTGERLIDLVGGLQKIPPPSDMHPLYTAVSLWSASPDVTFRLGGKS